MPPGGLRAMGRPKATVRDSYKTIKRLLPYWGRHKLALMGVALCAVLSSGVTVATPLVIADTIDNCISTSGGVSMDFTSMARHLALLFALYVTGMAAGWAQEIGICNVSHRVARRMKSDMMARLLRLDVEYFDTHSRGDTLSRFTNDAEMIRDGMGQTIVQMVNTLVTMACMVACMVAMSARLTVLVCLSIPLVALLTKAVTQKSRRLFREQQDAAGRLNGIIEESAGGLLTIRTLGAEDEWRKKFDKANHEMRSAGERAQINSGILMPMLRLLDNSTYIVVAVAGGVMATSGAITIGIIQAFLLYTRRFLRPVNMIATQLNTLQSAVAGAERIFDMMDQAAKVESARKAPSSRRIEGRVAFEHVSFSYKDGQEVLHDVNLTASPGETVAIVGGTGAGKTTLMNLLVRFYDAKQGRVTVDDVDVRDFDISQLRKSMAIVLQDPTLFGGTVTHNISYGAPWRKKLADVKKSARKALADTFIERLAQCYDTELTQQGNDLSNGQRQQLTIARAIHSDAAILILDEATSNIDSRTEAQLQSAISNMARGRTCFIIAHRLSTVRKADKIVVLDKGRVVETGDHESLMKQGGKYKSLFDCQFAR